MFKSKTTFIIGAGASKEVGMPVGTELAEIIHDKCDLRFDEFGRTIKKGDARIFSYFQQKDFENSKSYADARMQFATVFLLKIQSMTT